MRVKRPGAPAPRRDPFAAGSASHPGSAPSRGIRALRPWLMARARAAEIHRSGSLLRAYLPPVAADLAVLPFRIARPSSKVFTILATDSFSPTSLVSAKH